MLISTSLLYDAATRLQSEIVEPSSVLGIVVAGYNHALADHIAKVLPTFVTIVELTPHQPTTPSLDNHLAIGTRPSIHHDVTEDPCSRIVQEKMILEIWVRQHGMIRWHTFPPIVIIT